MSGIQRTMIHRLGTLANEFSDEFIGHRDRQHRKREALREAQLVLIKAQARYDEIARDRFRPKEQQERYLREGGEELQDARNIVRDIEVDIERTNQRMEVTARDRDRARKLAQALERAAGTLHIDSPRVSGLMADTVVVR